MRLPFEPLDKLCFAGSRAPFASCAPTWRLVVHGHLELAWIRAAVSSLLPRYPSLASRVVALDGPIERARRFAWELDDAPEFEQLVTELDLRAVDAEARARAEEALADRYLDITARYPFLCTWARLPEDAGEERSVLYLQQHHSLADGRAFLGLIRDLIGCLDCAARGVPLPDLGPAIPRLPELAVIPAQGFDRTRARLRGIAQTIKLGTAGTLSKSQPLFCNLGNDPTGGDRTVHVRVAESREELWKRARGPLGISVNDLLTGALATALARWSERQGTKPGRTRMVVVVDSRPRDRPFESFANHLGSMILSMRLDQGPRVLALSQALARQTRAQRGRGVHLDRLLAEAPLTQALPMHWLRHTIFEKPKLFVNYTFSNLIPLGTPGAQAGGKWRGHGFVIDDLCITTPTLPPQGASTTASRYGGFLSFNFNYKASVLNLAAMTDLGATFEEALAEAEEELRALPAAALGTGGKV